MKAIVCIAILLLGFLILQCWNPPIDHPAVTGRIQAPPAVTAILERACFDCHSNENRLRWYDKLAPASWLVNADIREARSRFNLSTFDSLKPAEQQGLLWEMVNMIINGDMPLGSYTAIHRSARVSPQEIEVLKNYLASLDHYKPGDTALIGAAHRELEEYANHPRLSESMVAADGVRYIDSFASWQVISTTYRFDLHALRVVYANAPAVEAIRSGHVSSFPEGATIVKAVWNSLEDDSGHIRPGTVNSIQIMTKDDHRFPATKGWGFAKFNGVKLMPYGEHASFNTTCYNCHTMAKDFGYVFNVPPTREIFDAGQQRVITAFADKKQQTMCTLYGNEIGRMARPNGNAPAGTPSPGAVYTLVTWRQVKNTFWYGSNINGPLLSVERVTVSPDSRVSYEVVKGTAPADAQARIALILGQRPAVFP